MDDDEYQDESQWSDCSSADMALAEERLYGLVYHSSDTFDLPDNASPGQSNGSKSHDVADLSQLPAHHSELRPAFYSKVSRLDNVKHIIDYADRKRDSDNLNRLRDAGYNQNGQSKSAYFASLSKELSNLPRQAEVVMPRKRTWRQNPLHNQYQTSEVNVDVPLNRSLPLDSIGKGSNRASPNSFKRNLPDCSGVKNQTNQGHKSFSFDLSTHNITTPGKLFSLFSPFNSPQSVTKEANNHTFHLDDRLFVSKPLNMNVENDLIAEHKASKSKRNRLNRKKKKVLAFLKLSGREEVKVVDVIKPNDSLSTVVVNDVVLVDEVDVVEGKYNMILKPKDTTMKGSVAKPCEVIVIDSGDDDSILLSDSDESVRVVPLPVPSVPLIIAVEDSSEEEPLKKRMVPKEVKQPDLDPDHVDSSFDFLDSSYDMEVLANSQARLLSKFISNHGSKESLLDERLFEHSPPIAVVVAVASCSSPALDGDLPNQVDNISSSTSNSSRASSPPDQPPSASCEAPTNLTNSEKDGDTFKTPPKQAKKRKLSSKTPLKQVANDDNTEVSDLKSVEVNYGDSAESHTTPGTNKEIRILDYINARIALRKAKPPHQFKIPQSNEHIVATKPPVAVESVEEDVQIVEVRVQEKTTDSPCQPLSGKKRKREEQLRKEREEVEVIHAEDVVAVHSGSKSRVSIEEIIGFGAGGVLMEEPPNKREKLVVKEGEEVRVLKKSKKKGKRERERTRERLERFKRSRPANEVIEYTPIHGDAYVTAPTPSCPLSWTREMRRFYNDSWGGENMDVQKIQQLMPGNPLMWQLSTGDLYPPADGRKRQQDIKCHNCRQMGHMSYKCNSVKALKCVMCGNDGHSKERCPEGLCLKCGQPARGFVKDCGHCRANAYKACPTCVYLHDPAQPCRDATHRGAAAKRSQTASPRNRPWNQGAPSGHPQANRGGGGSNRGGGGGSNRGGGGSNRGSSNRGGVGSNRGGVSSNRGGVGSNRGGGWFNQGGNHQYTIYSYNPFFNNRRSRSSR